MNRLLLAGILAAALAATLAWPAVGGMAAAGPEGGRGRPAVGGIVEAAPEVDQGRPAEGSAAASRESAAPVPGSEAAGATAVEEEAGAPGAPQGPSSAPAPPEAPSASIRRTLKNAREAMKQQQHLEALREYENVVARTQGGSPTAARAEALFGAGLLRLSEDAVTPDIARGEALLREFLETYPDHRYAAGALVSLELLAAAKESRQEAGRLKEELRGVQAVHQEDHDALTNAVKAAEAEAGTRAEESKLQAEKIDKLQKDVAQLNARLDSLRAELNSKDADLQKKDAALRRMKQALTEPRTPITPGGDK